MSPDGTRPAPQLERTKAQLAVDRLRDFAREHGMDFRQRDPLVMAIHEDLDRLTAAEATRHQVEQERDALRARNLTLTTALDRKMDLAVDAELAIRRATVAEYTRLVDEQSKASRAALIAQLAALRDTLQKDATGLAQEARRAPSDRDRRHYCDGKSIAYVRVVRELQTLIDGFAEAWAVVGAPDIQARLRALVEQWRTDGAACRAEASDAYARGCADAIELRVDALADLLQASGGMYERIKT